MLAGQAEKVTAAEKAAAALVARAQYGDGCEIHGFFIAEHFDPEGNFKSRDVFANTVVTVGKNLTLDAALAGSAYSVTGPYMGLISSTSFSAISAADTMASHAGWVEAGNANAPAYTSPRKTCVWSSASAGAKALSAALSFVMAGAGTVKGAFIIFGTGAVSTLDDTNGTLFSAGLFTGGDKTVGVGDTLQISYSVGL